MFLEGFLKGSAWLISSTVPILRAIALCGDDACIALKWTWCTGRDDFYSDHVHADLHVEICKYVDRTILLIHDDCVKNIYLEWINHRRMMIKSIICHNSQQKWGNLWWIMCGEFIESCEDVKNAYWAINSRRVLNRKFVIISFSWY